MEKAMYFVKKINSPYLGVYPDIGNLTNAVENPSADIRAGRGHIFAAHLKQTLPGIFREVPYEAGRVDFKRAAKTLYTCGVRMFVAEFWDNGGDYRKVLENNRKFLGKVLESAIK